MPGNDSTRLEQRVDQPRPATSTGFSTNVDREPRERNESSQLRSNSDPSYPTDPSSNQNTGLVDLATLLRDYFTRIFPTYMHASCPRCHKWHNHIEWHLDLSGRHNKIQCQNCSHPMFGIGDNRSHESYMSRLTSSTRSRGPCLDRTPSSLTAVVRFSPRSTWDTIYSVPEVETTSEPDVMEIVSPSENLESDVYTATPNNLDVATPSRLENSGTEVGNDTLIQIPSGRTIVRGPTRTGHRRHLPNMMKKLKKLKSRIPWTLRSPIVRRPPRPPPSPEPAIQTPNSVGESQHPIEQAPEDHADHASDFASSRTLTMPQTGVQTDAIEERREVPPHIADIPDVLEASTREAFAGDDTDRRRYATRRRRTVEAERRNACRCTPSCHCRQPSSTHATSPSTPQPSPSRNTSLPTEDSAPREVDLWHVGGAINPRTNTGDSLPSFISELSTREFSTREPSTRRRAIHNASAAGSRRVIVLQEAAQDRTVQEQGNAGEIQHEFPPPSHRNTDDEPPSLSYSEETAPTLCSEWRSESPTAMGVDGVLTEAEQDIELGETDSNDGDRDGIAGDRTPTQDRRIWPAP